MNPDKSFSNLTMSEKRKRLMAIVERKNMKRKRFEMPSMLEKGGSINIQKPKVKKPINGSTKTKKINAHTYKKLFQNRGSKVKKASHVDDHIAAGSDASNDSHEIEEYWVPVHLSHMQIEAYCSLLNSNFETLSSSLKDDSSLSDILTQTQKCCDHPYLVDPTLRESLKTDVGDDRWDAEISVSGKLQFLDKLLVEIKRCGLRVLVLFQSPIIWKSISIGDMLDDLVNKRFGHDSYIRIHGKIISKTDRVNRKRDIKMFNNVEAGKFVCLLDYRSCHSILRLSSIDVVILFNSDWNPSNDIKALRKLTLDSKPPRVLRLYSSLTVEEKALILSKQGSIYENNTARISYNNCHRLLAWGASYFFSQLSNKPSKSKSKSDDCFMDDLVHELSSLLLNGNGNTKCSKSSIAKTHEGGYSRNILLLGENETQTKESCSKLMENGPLVFWTDLLKESPWDNLCTRLSRRAKRSFRNPDYSYEVREAENENFPNNPVTVTSTPVRKRLRRKRRRAHTEFAQSTNGDAECTNNQPQTSPVVPPVSDQSCTAGPLESELENIKKKREKVNKLHEEKKSMLQSECEREILEIRKKYDALVNEAEICLTKEVNAIDEYYDLVYANKLLAEALTQTCDDTFTEEKTEKECSSSMKILEIASSELVQSRIRSTSRTNIPTLLEIPASELVRLRTRSTSTPRIPILRAPAPHLRSSSSLFATLPTLEIPSTQTEVKNLNNQEIIEKLQSSNSWPELLAECDSFFDMGYPSLPFLE